MSKRIRVKPGKGQSTAGFFGGLIFCCIGIFIVIPIFGPIGVIWTLFAVVITIVNGLNAFSDQGIASHEIIIDDSHQDSTEHSKTSEERMNELKSLYQKGMINEDEYQNKRKQILEEI